MSKLTDKQLLQLNKNDLLKEYRKLEESHNLSLEEAIKIVEQNNMTVKKKTSYHF